MNSPRRVRHAWLLSLPLLGLFAMLVCTFLLERRTSPQPEDGPTAAAPAAVPPLPEQEASSPAVPEAEPERHPASTATATAPPPPAISFEQLVRELAGLGERTAQLVQDDEIPAAKQNDALTRERFTLLMTTFPDAGERALAMLGELDPDPASHDRSRRVVLRLVLATECRRRHEGGAPDGDAAFGRDQLDALVHGALAAMPQAETTAATLVSVLADQPYLHACHEPDVLQLTALAGEGRFAREHATRLLATLWRNLRDAGERTSAELTQLALVLLDDADPSRRTIACRHLLEDERYRPLVLAWLREHADRAVAAEVATLAARELEPPLALRTLRELAPVLPRLTGAYRALGIRAPELLADSYRELLASDTHASVRADLVAGAASSPTPASQQFAQLAFTSDPSPEVRLQAAFGITAAGDGDQAERVCGQLLDDAAVARDPARLGAVVLMLQNLEAGGHTNAVDRLGTRLRSLPLAPASRELLDGILARSLPGGRTLVEAALERSR